MTNKDNRICLESQEENGRDWITADESDEECSEHSRYIKDLIDYNMLLAAKSAERKYDGYFDIVVTCYPGVYTIEE